MRPVARVADVQVSNVPSERIAQLDGFFRRNPGYAATAPLADALRGAAATLPFGSSVTAALTPTELGYGQLLHDQMAWQERSGRQPTNPWWMEMNFNLVGDPLRAEALVRAGTPDAAPNDSVAAWAKYVQASDAVQARLGLPIGQPQVTNADGVAQPVALSDVSRTASLGDRVAARFREMPAARRAMWDAHRATLDVHYPESEPELRAVAEHAPGEAKFMSGWANIVGYIAKVNPIATGRWALLGQEVLLPDEQFTPDAAPEAPQKRAFAHVLQALDANRYSRVVGA
ncbi:MAG: hypothetical protein JWO69_531 [Thermoleophilia bacterium]|nr:hypothetical protein [Thermoleophilia bacterium]